MSLIRTNWPSLSDFFDDDWPKSRFTNGDWSPAVNVVDNENHYEIEVAAPGLKKKDFSVAVENGVLTISGQTENEIEGKEKNYTRKEFSSRSFVKSFTLPENVRDEEISARYDEGVLRLILKKVEKHLPPKKEVAIQ